MNVLRARTGVTISKIDEIKRRIGISIRCCPALVLINKEFQRVTHITTWDLNKIRTERTNQRFITDELEDL
jgi:hypothetical protein